LEMVFSEGLIYHRSGETYPSEYNPAKTVTI
jgi:hypothetical protein